MFRPHYYITICNIVQVTHPSHLVCCLDTVEQEAR